MHVAIVTIMGFARIVVVVLGLVVVVEGVVLAVGTVVIVVVGVAVLAVCVVTVLQNFYTALSLNHVKSK